MYDELEVRIHKQVRDGFGPSLLMHEGEEKNNTDHITIFYLYFIFLVFLKLNPSGLHLLL